MVYGAANISSKARTRPTVLMLMTVMNGEFAVKKSIELIKAFKSMRNYLENHGRVDSNIYIPPCFFIFL